jgi:hypothetical protein
MEEKARRSLVCPGCQVPLSFAGTKNFHEGSRAWDVMGGVWEMFKNREALDAYFCPRCGRVEFFVSGVGEDPGAQGLHDSGVDDDAVPLSLAALEPDEDGVEDDDLLPEWNCASCGEAVPGNFAACWNCNAPRPSGHGMFASPGWDCPGCGEVVRGFFTKCWKCHTTRPSVPRA